MAGHEIRRRYYSRELLLKLRESPLVERPVELPQLDTWALESRNKADINDDGRKRGPNRGDASGETAKNANESVERSGPRLRSGLDKNMVLGPPKMNFASSAKKLSDSNVSVDEASKSSNPRINSGSDLGLPQLKGSRNLEDQSDRGDRVLRSYRNDSHDGQLRSRWDDGMNRTRLNDVNRSSAERRRPDSSNSLESTNSSSRFYQEDRTSVKSKPTEQTPEWMDSASSVATTPLSAALSQPLTEKFTKLSLLSENMDEIAKFRARMKEKERVARGEQAIEQSANENQSSSSALDAATKGTKFIGSAIPVKSEADRKAEEVALGRVDPSLAALETGADALLSKKLLSVNGGGNQTSANINNSSHDKSAPRFRRFFELEGEQTSQTSQPSSLPSPVLNVKHYDDGLFNNPIEMLSKRFPDAVISKTSDAPPRNPAVMLSEADLLAKFGVAAFNNKTDAPPPSSNGISQPTVNNDDFSRVMLMLTKQMDVFSPPSMSSSTSGFPIGANNEQHTIMSMRSQPSSSSNVVSLISGPLSQRPPFNHGSASGFSPVLNSTRPNFVSSQPIHSNSIAGGRAGGVYAQHASQTGLAAMVQAGILAKKSSNSAMTTILGDPSPSGDSDIKMPQALLSASRAQPSSLGDMADTTSLLNQGPSPPIS